MREFKGLWYPDGDSITKNMVARLADEEFYRCDRFHDAMKHVRAWRGAVECGAHVGAWSRELAKRFQAVVAIELNAETANCLRRNLEPHPNATAVNCALGSAPGWARVSGSKGSIDCEVSADGAPVSMQTVDGVVAAAAGMSAVDYMKVHVNGYELEVLRGAEQTIRRHRPAMTVVIKKALEKYGTTPEQILDFMARQGYQVASRLKPYWVFVPR